jgi:hypothetical protein
MAFFQHDEPKRKSPADQAADSVAKAFNNHFKEELRERGREHFDKLLAQNEKLFQKELDDTIDDVNQGLRKHIITKFENEIGKYVGAVKDAQEEAIKTLKASTQDLIEYQESISDTQDEALASLEDSVKDFNQKQEKLGETLAKSIASQEEKLVAAFEENMARIVENYIVGALGDQFDVKAQLPAIIKQMEDKKQAILDDIKL